MHGSCHRYGLGTRSISALAGGDGRLQSASLLTPAVITLIGFGIRLGLDGAKLRTEAPCECGRHGPHSTLVGTGGAALADDVAIRLSAVVSGAAVVAAVVGTLDVTPAPLLPRIVTGCTPV